MEMKERCIWNRKGGGDGGEIRKYGIEMKESEKNMVERRDGHEGEKKIWYRDKGWR